MNRTLKALVLLVAFCSLHLPCLADYAIITAPESFNITLKPDGSTVFGGKLIGVGSPLSIGIRIVNSSPWNPVTYCGAYLGLGYGTPLLLGVEAVGGPGDNGTFEIPASAFSSWGDWNPAGGPYTLEVQAISFGGSYFFKPFYPLKVINLNVTILPPDGPPPASDTQAFDDGSIGGESGKGEKKPKERPEEPKPEECPLPEGNKLAEHPDGYQDPPNVDDPVNLMSGNWLLTEVDGRLKSRNPLTLTRYYNSIDTRKGPFGRGWSSAFLSHLMFSDTEVTFVNSDGAGVTFQKTGSNFVPADPYCQLALALATDTDTYTISHPNGESWSFDENGKIIRLAQVCCGRGAVDALLFDYNADGALHRVTNPAGQWFEFHSDTNKLITSISDSSGRIFGYAYDSAGNLTSFTDPTGAVTRYSYNTDGFMTSVERPGTRTTTVAYANGKVTSVRDPNGNTNTFEWFDSPRKVINTEPNGTAHTYLLDADGKVTDYSAVGTAIKYIASGSLLAGYTDANGKTWNYTYNSDRMLSGITDPTGVTSEFEYHPTFKKVTKKKDALGREWKYAWCYRGNLISETDPNGGVTSYTYDVWNNRTGRTDQMGRLTRFEYDSTGNYLVRTIDPMGGTTSFTHDGRGNLLTVTEPLNRVTVFEYDLLDRLTKTTYPDGRTITLVYDAAGNVVTRRDNLGRETTYTYSPTGLVTEVTRPDGTKVQSAYDQAGRKTSETDPLNRVTRFEYDGLGRLVKTTFPDSTCEAMGYDGEGRLTVRVDELGQRTSFEYDPIGRLLATIDPAGGRWEAAYDTAGRKVSEKDPLGRITTYQHDVLDRIVRVTRPDGSTGRNAFDAVGNLLSATDALGFVWAWKYDAVNRAYQAVRPDGAISSTTFDAAGQVVSDTDPLNRVTAFAYDQGGRRIKTTEPSGAIWTLAYDTAGRLVKATDPTGAFTSTAYDLMDRTISETDQLGNTTRFEFDTAGRRVAKTDPLGRRSVTVFDLRDRVISEADPEGRTVTLGYDLAGRRVRLTDGANRTWRWAYDALGRVTMETDPLGNTVLSRYDMAGNRVGKTNARGSLTAYAFDAMDRLVKVTYPDGAVATFAYDLESREISRSGLSGRVTKQWDAVGNLLAETFGPFGKTWSYSFDKAGNRIQAKSPEGQTFRYRYDSRNQVIYLDPPSVGDEVGFTYDTLGRPTAITRPGGVTRQTFDKASRLLQITHEKTSGRDRVIALRKYDYDQVGNRLSMLDEEGQTTRFAYDRGNWLTRAVYPGGEIESFEYNRAGDRLKRTIEIPKNRRATDTNVIVYGYDGGGRMTSAGSEAFAYDRDGNLVKATDRDEETRYFWSSDNRLVKVERETFCGKHRRMGCRLYRTPKVDVEEYGYLPEDWRRITRKADGQTYVSIYDGDDESHEYVMLPKVFQKEWRFGPFCWKPKLPQYFLLREFIGGPGTDDIEATRYHGRNLWHLKDALGSTIALANRGGNPVAKIGYDAWGNMRWPDNPRHGAPPCRWEDLDDLLDRLDFGRGFGFMHDAWWHGRHHGHNLTPYLFAGRRLDAFTKTYQNRHRQYNPRVGRFLSSDPISFRGGNNLYAYVNNNPLLWVDSLGLVWDTALQILRRNPNYKSLADELEEYMEKEDAKSIFGLGQRVQTNPCIPAQDRKVVYREIIRDKAMWEHIAKEHGFTKKIPANKAHFDSHGQPVYQKRKRYITPDVDSHSGGYWKLFDQAGRRHGTLNEHMEYIGP